ncbi:MAG: hypothetical protein IKK51_06935 [Oscillospiraceae bacterium]|nr:hypothetical protein [Oscillospiraceae bacterium]
MKKRNFTLILCLMMASYGCCGCMPTSETQNEQPMSIQASNDTSAGIPENLKVKLQAALDAPPVPIPEEGWTDETLADVIYINGEKMKLSCTVSDFGEGFEIVTDDEFFYIDDQKTAHGVSQYYDRPIGIFKIRNCTDASDVYKKQYKQIGFFKTENSSDIFPIALNGITIGSNYEETVKRLGLEYEDSTNGADGSFFMISIDTESISLVVSGTNCTVDKIFMTYKDNKKEMID